MRAVGLRTNDPVGRRTPDAGAPLAGAASFAGCGAVGAAGAGAGGAGGAVGGAGGAATALAAGRDAAGTGVGIRIESERIVAGRGGSARTTPCRASFSSAVF